MATTLDAILDAYDIHNRKSLYAELESLLDSKESEISLLRNEVSVCDDDIDSFKNELKEKEEKISSLKDELDELEMSPAKDTFIFSLSSVDVHIQNGNMLLTQLFEALADAEQRVGALKVLNHLETLK